MSDFKLVSLPTLNCTLHFYSDQCCYVPQHLSNDIGRIILFTHVWGSKNPSTKWDHIHSKHGSPTRSYFHDILTHIIGTSTDENDVRTATMLYEILSTNDLDAYKDWSQYEITSANGMISSLLMLYVFLEMQQ